MDRIKSRPRLSLGAAKALAKVELVSISTTLATNAIVEGRGQKVGLLILPPYGLFDGPDIPYRPIAVLRGTGRFGTPSAATMTALVGIAAVAGVICYVLYYRLDEVARYWDGMAPLATDAFVMAVFLGVLAFS